MISGGWGVWRFNASESLPSHERTFTGDFGECSERKEESVERGCLRRGCLGEAEQNASGNRSNKSHHRGLQWEQGAGEERPPSLQGAKKVAGRVPVPTSREDKLGSDETGHPAEPISKLRPEGAACSPLTVHGETRESRHDPRTDRSSQGKQSLKTWSILSFDVLRGRKPEGCGQLLPAPGGIHSLTRGRWEPTLPSHGGSEGPTCRQKSPQEVPPVTALFSRPRGPRTSLRGQCGLQRALVWWSTPGESSLWQSQCPPWSHTGLPLPYTTLCQVFKTLMFSFPISTGHVGIFGGKLRSFLGLFVGKPSVGARSSSS